MKTKRVSNKFKKGDAVLIHGSHLDSSKFKGWQKARVVSVGRCQCSRCRKLPLSKRRLGVSIRLRDRIWQTSGLELRPGRAR